MNSTFYLFVGILAIILAVCSTATVVIKLILQITYNKSITKRLDAVKGYTRTYPIKKPLIVMLVSYAWIAVLLVSYLR